MNNEVKFETIEHNGFKYPNEVASFGHYYLSKNNNSDTFGCPTTAVVIKDGDINRIFLILNGYEHGDKLLEVAKDRGLIGCVEYFIENIKDANHLPDYLLLGDSDDIIFKTYRVLGVEYTSKIHFAAVDASTISLKNDLSIDELKSGEEVENKSEVKSTFKQKTT